MHLRQTTKLNAADFFVWYYLINCVKIIENRQKVGKRNEIRSSIIQYT